MSFRSIILITAVAGIIFSSGAASSISAQVENSSATPRVAPTPPLDPIFAKQIPEPPAPLPVVSREQRAAAYAKLLEGQRYLWALQRLRSQTGIAASGKSAREALLQSIEANPGLAETYAALAELSFNLRLSPAEVERTAKIAVRLDSNNFGGHQTLARFYTVQSGLNRNQIDRNFAEKAVAAWREIARLDSRNAEAWAFLSHLYESLEQNEKAIESLRNWSGTVAPFEDRFYGSIMRGQSLAPENAVPIFGRILLRSGRTGEAIEMLSRAVADEPENPEAVAALQDALEQSTPEEAAKSIESLRQASFAAPSNLVLLEVFVSTQIRAGMVNEELLKTVQNARQRFPEEAGLIRSEAEILRDLGRVDEAVTLLRSKIVNKTRQISVPDALNADFISYLTISNFYIQAGRGSDAVIAAQQALGLAQTDRMTQIGQLMLATAQNSANDFKSAEITLREILKKEPNNSTALNNLGYFLVERGERLPEAIELIKRAVEIEPENASFLDSLGWAQFRSGKVAEAEKSLTEAAKRNPSSAAIQHHLGDLYNKQGKTEAAKTAWRKALSLENDSAEAEKIRAKLGEPKKSRK
jgi:tetratricopeptide (TPR) repeat protein